MTSWSIFYTVAVSQGIFLSVVLLAIPKGNRTANRILSVLVLLLTIYLLDILLGFHDFFQSYPNLFGVTIPFWYLFPPLAYLYVRIQINPKFEWKWIHLLHLAPFFLFVWRLIPLYQLSSELKLEVIVGALGPPESHLVQSLFVLVSPLQIIVYSIFMYRELKKEMANEEFYPAHLSWMRFFTVLLLLFGTMQLILITKWIITQRVTLQFKLIPLTIFSVIVYSIAYLAVVRPEFIFPYSIGSKRKTNGENSKALADQLTQLMESDKPYLKSELRYSEIALRLGISARGLTELLKHEIGMSFSDFVNSYRVNEVKERIHENNLENLTLLAIALDAGFNSKTSFNRVFKKHSGLTPSEYIANINQQSNS